MSPSFDSHVHIWERPWENFIVGTAREGRFAQRDLILALMDRHGVERACLVAACNKQNPDNNEFVAELCRAQPDRFVMFSEIRMTEPSRDGLLGKTISDWPALGFRYMVPPDETPAKWSGPADAAFWERVNTQRLLVAFNLNPQQAAALPPLIERYPQITWLLDHMGRPCYNMKDSDYELLLNLSTYANVYIKISGFYAFTEHQPDYPYQDLAPFLKGLLKKFGSRRMLWGSDAPPVLDFSSYEQTFACLRHLLPATSTEDLMWIMGRTAKKLLLKK
jgi:predicted TIM-barrel fold metal-dependent hydrolase